MTEFSKRLHDTQSQLKELENQRQELQEELLEKERDLGKRVTDLFNQVHESHVSETDLETRASTYDSLNERLTLENVAEFYNALLTGQSTQQSALPSSISTHGDLIKADFANYIPKAIENARADQRAHVVAGDFREAYVSSFDSPTLTNQIEQAGLSKQLTASDKKSIGHSATAEFELYIQREGFAYEPMRYPISASGVEALAFVPEDGFSMTNFKKMPKQLRKVILKNTYENFKMPSGNERFNNLKVLGLAGVTDIPKKPADKENNELYCKVARYANKALDELAQENENLTKQNGHYIVSDV